MHRDVTEDRLPKAAARGDLALVRSLVKSGWNMEARGPASWDETVSTGDNKTTKRHKYPETTAVYRAAEAGHFDIVLFLLQNGANANVRDHYNGKRGNSILITVVRKDFEKTTRLLLEYGSSYVSEALLEASDCSTRNIVHSLLQYDADIEATDSNGQTPLYKAAVRGSTSITKLLLQEGARFDAIMPDGQSALCKAAGRGHSGAVRHLLRYGADPTVGQGRHGETMIYKAAWFGDFDVVRLLLDYGIDCNLPNAPRMTGYRNVYEQVLHGVAAGTRKSHSMMNAWGKRALHAAAYRGHEDVVQLLLENGAEVDAVGNDGETAVYLAGHEHKGGVVKLLLRAGAKMKTEKYDPVLAVLNEQNEERGGPQEVVQRFNDPQALEQMGTDDMLVGFIAQLTQNFARGRR